MSANDCRGARQSAVRKARRLVAVKPDAETNAAPSYEGPPSSWVGNVAYAPTDVAVFSVERSSLTPGPMVEAQARSGGSGPWRRGLRPVRRIRL
jgi:hypothetical protein